MCLHVCVCGGGGAGGSILYYYGEKPSSVKLSIFSELIENSAKFMKNSGLTASEAPKLKPTQGPIDSQRVIRRIRYECLLYVIFFPSLLTAYS